jgi:Kef-type K+ transport system membrane component KefB
VSVSVVLLLFLLAWMQMRNRSLKPSHAITCVLLGFCLASSSLAPTIQSTLVSTASLVGTIRP